MHSNSLSVFDYIDYRLYLGAYYQLHKEKERSFSHRLMARRLGFTSPNFLKLVMDGKRNISKESLGKITRGLNLNKQETEYFSYLVFFAQAKSAIDKNYYFGLIAAMRSRKNIASLAPDQFEYFSDWYHPAVRELVSGMAGPLDFEALSSKLDGKVTAAKIRKSVELLIRLGLITLDGDSAYRASSPLLNTKNELNSFSIRHYHAEVLDIARQSLENVEPKGREFSHLTVKISPDGFAKIKQRIQDFREEILQMVAGDKQTNEVCHVNFQFYPVTKGDHHEKTN
jgi:uncharacterized protein (TIGR02147 family)